MKSGKSPHYQRLYNRGIMFLNSGEYERALDAFEKARDVWDNSYAYSGMGRAYYGLERYKKALSCFERAYTMYRGNLQAAHWRAKTLGRLGRYDEAANQFESVLIRLSNGPISFQQEVLADYEEMKDERDGIDSTRSHGRNTSGIYGKYAQPAPRIIVKDNQGSVNIGGIQANDDAVINRSMIDDSIEITKTDDKPADFLKSDSLKKQNEVRIIRKGLFSYQCSECGGKVKKDDSFCTKCGRKLT